MKKALIVWGGWDGHEPELVAGRFQKALESEGFGVEVSDTLDAFLDQDKLMALDLIVPVWTMGSITAAQRDPVMRAVEAGVGLAGCHGGMCDSFRNDTEWQFMTGSQWVAHPGNDGTRYKVEFVRASDSPIIAGLEDFEIASEQYYIHVDPANHVLATTRFPVADGPHAANGAVDVPVAYTRRWGKGKVFYSSLGHLANVFDVPQAIILQTRGMCWAAK